MILVGTTVKVIDNSGARLARCLHLYRCTPDNITIGDVILVSLLKTYVNQTFKKKKQVVAKGEMFKALVVRTRKPVFRTGHIVRADSNAVILLDKNLTPIGSRIISPVFEELRKKNFGKLLALSPAVV